MALKKKPAGLSLAVGQVGRGVESLGSSSRTLKLRRVPMTTIRPNPHNERRQFGETDLTELARSIEQVGLLQPPLVRRGDDPDTWVLVAGERRWRACMILGHTHLDVLEVEQGSGTASLIENLQREQLQPLDEARGLQALMTRDGLTAEALSAAIGKSPAYVSGMIGLLRLDESIQKSPDLNQVSTNALIELSRLHSTDQLYVWTEAQRDGEPVTVARVRRWKAKVVTPKTVKPPTERQKKPLARKGWEALASRVEGHAATDHKLTPEERKAAERLHQLLTKVLEF